MTTAIIGMMKLLGDSAEGVRAQLDLIRFLRIDETVISVCYERESLGPTMENVLHYSDPYAIQGRGFSEEDIKTIDDVARGWMKKREAKE